MLPVGMFALALGYTDKGMSRERELNDVDALTVNRVAQTPARCASDRSDTSRTGRNHSFTLTEGTPIATLPQTGKERPYSTTPSVRPTLLFTVLMRPHHPD